MYIKPIKRFENYFKTVITENLVHQAEKKAKEVAADKGKEQTPKCESYKTEKYRIVDISYAFTNRKML